MQAAETSTTPTTPRRRALAQLAGGVTLGTAAVGAVTADAPAAAEADPHAGWVRKSAALDEFGVTLPDEADRERCFLAAADIDKLICDTPACTCAGVFEQLRAVWRVLLPEGLGLAGLDNSIAALGRRAAR
jgi:hypothetical protein